MTWTRTPQNVPTNMYLHDSQISLYIQTDLTLGFLGIVSIAVAKLNWSCGGYLDWQVNQIVNIGFNLSAFISSEFLSRGN